jgi:hypothetical protein
MQKIALLAISFLLIVNTQAQQTGNKKNKIDLSNRPGDHIMVQFSLDNLAKMPDSINSHQSGFSKGLNAYFMLDKPFKSSPKYSIGLGIGVGSSNIAFKKMFVDIKSTGTKLPFTATDSTNHWKKFKLSLSYLEIPLEFRFSSDPLNPSKSWKFALGLKAGTLINAHTKGKELQNKNNSLVNDYIQKENSKKFFNGTRFVGTARLGYGIISLFGAYQLNNVLKDVPGPPMKLYQLGITLSGL